MFYSVFDLVRNTYFEELDKLPPYLRQAQLFSHVVEDMPLQIRKEDLIAGWYGYEDSSAATVENPKRFAFRPVLSEQQRKIRQAFSKDLKMDIGFTAAHTCIDYGTVLEKGLIHYMDLVEKALGEYPQDECLQAMKSSLEAACRYAERYAALAQKMAAEAGDEGSKARLAKIHSALCQVPRYGARDFLEAVQAVWLMHTVVPIAEMSWASISLGRMDQYLYPYYKKHLEEGGSRQKAKDILKNLFLLLDSYGDGACALNIGGMDIDGQDVMNELSQLLIEVEKEMALRAPILAVRVTPDTPEEILDELIDFELFKIGQPTFYGEIPCRQAVMTRGIDEKEAAGFSANSCMGLILAGKEFADMWGIKFNAHLPLELAVNLGQPLHGMLPFETKIQPEKISSFEQLLQTYCCYFEQIMPQCAMLQDALSREAQENTPDPLLSALTEGCIQKRCDRAVGAVYNTVTVETMGLINTIDALEAIRELVFEQKKYSLQDFVTAAKADFEGWEKLRGDILKCAKYGANDANVNAIANQLCGKIYEICQANRMNNRLFLPSLHTIDVNVWYGSGLYSTLDGRRKGEPVNKNANPSALLLNTEHTSVVLSAAALGQNRFSGGQPIDLYFDRAWFEQKASRDNIKALILTYFQMGGLQLQVNSIDIPLLEKAHLEPEKYPFVIVRKGGYSVRFNELGKEAREDLIRQAKNYN